MTLNKRSSAVRSSQILPSLNVPFALYRRRILAQVSSTAQTEAVSASAKPSAIAAL
jgi:hypothetical protein